MYSTTVYNYIPRQQVMLYSGTSTRRYEIVYAKNLKLNKGVDNVIQFQIINQEQKPVNITDKQISFRLIGNTGTTILLKKTLTSLLPLTGLAQLTVSSAELMEIDAQLCNYSLVVIEGDLNLPVFIDDDAGARGVIQVLNSVLPSHIPSQPVTLVSHAPVSNIGTTYYSSVITTQGSSGMTLQTYVNDYSGSVQVQGSTVLDTNWYNIGPNVTFTHDSLTVGQTIEGAHPYVRLKFVSTSGNITQILAR
jgi:hypothetical protein